MKQRSEVSVAGGVLPLLSTIRVVLFYNPLFSPYLNYRRPK
jgi:hypothetical protein